MSVGLGWFRHRSAAEEVPRFLEHLGGGGAFFSMMRIYPDEGLGVVLRHGQRHRLRPRADRARRAPVAGGAGSDRRGLAEARPPGYRHAVRAPRPARIRPLRIHDPQRLALRGAIRATLVVPLVFAICDVGLDSRQAAITAVFGAIAFIVFADFTGPPWPRLRANLTLAATGAVLIPLGTLCSRNVVLATVMMAVVAFVVLFAGVLSGYFAAGGPAAVLMFVLPVMIPAGPGAIPDRLLGWGLACVASIAALSLLWPSQPHGRIRAAQAAACRALAGLVARVGAHARRHRSGLPPPRPPARRWTRWRPPSPRRPTARRGPPGRPRRWPSSSTTWSGCTRCCAAAPGRRAHGLRC